MVVLAEPLSGLDEKWWSREASRGDHPAVAARFPRPLLVADPGRGATQPPTNARRESEIREEDSLKDLPRKKRLKAFRPNGRDRSILQYVADYRFMSIELLAALIVAPPVPGRTYGFSESALRARCQKLRDNDFLTWQFLHDLPTGRGLHTERPAVYSIGPAALDFLEEEFSFSREQLKQSLEKNRLSSMFLRHFLMISKFHVCLELACRQTAEVGIDAAGTTVEIGTWLQDGLVDRVRVMIGEVAETIPVVPDAVFNLVVRQPDGAIYVKHFALEADRGTMPSRSITKKATGYWHYIRQKLQKRRYTYYGENGAGPELRVVNPNLKWDAIPKGEQEKILQYGVDDLTVLFVTRGETPDVKSLKEKSQLTRTRQNSIVEAVRRVDGIDADTSMFLFCTEALDFDINVTASLLDSSWQTSSRTPTKSKLLQDNLR